MSTLSENRFVVAWQSNYQDGNRYGIFAKVFGANGENTTAEIQVNYNATNDQKYPSIYPLSENKFAVAWQSLEQDGDDYGIFARVFDATNGENTTAEFQVNSNATNKQENPSICALSESRLVITWQSLEQDGDSYGIFARVFDATTGKSIMNTFQVNQNASNSQDNPFICALSNNKFIIGWNSLEQDGDDYGGYATIFSIDHDYRLLYFLLFSQYISETTPDLIHYILIGGIGLIVLLGIVTLAIILKKNTILIIKNLFSNSLFNFFKNTYFKKRLINLITFLVNFFII
jgi:hypothetical protein